MENHFRLGFDLGFVRPTFLVRTIAKLPYDTRFDCVSSQKLPFVSLMNCKSEILKTLSKAKIPDFSIFGQTWYGFCVINEGLD